MALAGGSSISIPQLSGYLYQEGGIQSPDGHCRAFDAKAKGTIGGRGVGIVVLKRLADALADRDNVLAVIKGSAVNNDGSRKVGFTAPSVEGQAKVIAMAQAVADIDPETISYIEAHGTGTALGDPIEVTALKRVFSGRTEKKQFCGIGSVKTNVGHLDAAAGIAGVIKTVLSLNHKMIPPSLHYEEPNREIDFAESPFYVNGKLKKWEREGSPRRAGISSFGIGGTNAHVIVEEAPSREGGGKSRGLQILVLSAKSEGALEAATEKLKEYLKARPETKLADAAYTLGVGRKRFEHRRVILCHDKGEAIEAIESRDVGKLISRREERSGRGVVMMFAGQGSQYVGMTRRIYEEEKRYREVVDRCSEELKAELGVDLREVIYGAHEERERAEELLNETWITQPALFVIEYGLARQWMEWGVKPEAMLGHSIGEYVAACVSGVFSVEEGLRLVARRARLMWGTAEGAMLAVAASEEEVRALKGERISIAAVNGERQVVVSGGVSEIEELEEDLRGSGIASKRLRVKRGFHSELMDEVMGSFEQEARKVDLRAPEIRYVSNVTGRWMKGDDARNAKYWVRQMREEVKYLEGMREVLRGSGQIVLEVGPGEELSGLVKREKRDGESAEVISSGGKRGRNEEEEMISGLGKLWLAGVDVDWSAYYKDEDRRRVELPSYPFQRQRYWVESSLPRREYAAAEPLQRTGGVEDWFYMPVWKQSTAPRGLQPKGSFGQRQCWLLFIDECGLGSGLAERLEQRGQDVVIVKAGSRFSAVNNDSYLLNPRHRGDYDELFRQLCPRKRVPRQIVHLWSVTSDDQPGSGEEGSGEEAFERLQYKGFYSLIFIAQALGNQNVTANIQIAVITTNVQTVTGLEPLSPCKSTVLGPCKVIPQEYSNIVCRSIDVALPPRDSWIEQALIDSLLAETVAGSDDFVVAYRAHSRWVQTFERVRLTVEDGPGPREGGVYMITGGLGRIGLELAEYLARTVKARLILVGRSPFPRRDEWEQWLPAHVDLDDTSQKIRGLLAIEQLGAEVEIVVADVTNEERMREVLHDSLERFGGINGVIHSAGADASRLAQVVGEVTPARCKEHFEPKAHGLAVLERVLHQEKLDFCLLVSSLSSVLGGLGFSAYAAANIFMDTFAQKQSQTNPSPWISINWEGWRFSEASQGHQTAFGTSTVGFALTPRQGVEALDRILRMSPTPRIVVASGDLQERMDRWIKLESVRGEKAQPAKGPSLYQRPNVTSEYVAPETPLEIRVADIWRNLLGIEEVGIHDDFFELGGHSLLGIQLISRLREAFRVDVPLQSLFGSPTIAEMTAAILQAQIQRMDEEQIDGILLELEQLPEEEAQLMIASSERAGSS